MVIERIHKDNAVFSFLPDDLFLVSYPRSGNRWIRYLLANLLYPEEEWTIKSLRRVVPDLHQPIPEPFPFLKKRIYKTHSINLDAAARIIYIYRDGRDVALSYYNFQSTLKNYSHDFTFFLNQMLQKGFLFGTWQDHLEHYLLSNKWSNFLPVQYENLFDDTAGNLKRIGDFIGCSFSEELIKNAITKSTFEKQQQDHFLYKYESNWIKGYHGGIRGRPGGWRESFSDEMNDLFWNYTSRICERIGYHYDRDL